MSIHINPIYLLSVVLVWILVYHVAYWLIAIVRDRSLICWSVGPLGITVVGLREPPVKQVLGQLGFGSLAVALVAYASVFAFTPSPVSGLERTLPIEAAVILTPVVLFTSARLLTILREHRFPLWGEARVLARVQRSRALGALVIFTPAGQTFLRERFGATPGEFLRMIGS